MPHKKIPKKDILDDLSKTQEKIDEYLSTKRYDEHGKYCSTTVKNRIGSWKEAKEQAGLEPLPPNQRQKYSEEELLQDLRDTREELGEFLSKNKYDEHGNYRSDLIRSRFGSWNQAKEKAGLETRTIERGYTVYDVVKDVKKVADELGNESLSMHDYLEHGRYSSVNNFEMSWNEIKEHAGLEINNTTRRINGEKVRLKAQKIYEEKGFISFGLLERRTEYSYNGMLRKFGSLDNLIPGEELDREEMIDEVMEQWLENLDNSGLRGWVKRDKMLRYKPEAHFFEPSEALKRLEDYIEENDPELDISRNNTKDKFYIDDQSPLVERYSETASHLENDNEVDAWKEMIKYGISPKGAAAAILYVNRDMTQSKVTEEIDVSEVTIRNCQDEAAELLNKEGELA